MPLDPQTAALLDGMAARPLAQDVGPEAEREHLERMAQYGRGRFEPVHSSEDIDIEGPDGPLTMRVLRPSSEPGLPVLLWLHGGGWVAGSRTTHDTMMHPVANGAECVVVLVDYRRAPEHPFPCAFDDSLATLRWLQAHADRVGGDPTRIAIGGDSAGGALAASIAQHTRADAVRPVAQVLVYPITDDDFDRPSMVDNATGFGLTRESLQYYSSAYLPNPADRDDPRALPIRHADLSDLPPALVLTAGYDPLRDEAEEYAQRMQAAGTPVELLRFDGLIHGFFGLGPYIDAANQGVVVTVAALRRAFGTA